MWVQEEEFAMKLGGNYYINVPNLIVYKGESLLTVTRATTNEALGITFKIYDSKGQKIASVNNGKIYADGKNKNVDNYKVTNNQDEFVLTDTSTNRILCRIARNAKAGFFELDIWLDLYTKTGFRIIASPAQTNLGTNILTGNTFKNAQNGLVIE